jgi:hypothetical protein
MGSQNLTNFYFTIFEYWNFGRIIAIQPMERRGPELRSMDFFTKFLIRHWNFWTLPGLEDRPQTQKVSCLTIFALRPLQRAFIHPILTAGTQVLLEKTHFSW